MKKGKGRRRLETLIRFMEGLPKSVGKHFYMGSFFEHMGSAPHPEIGRPLTRKGITDCGTASCAMGWATVCPSLKKQGLSLKVVAIDGEERARFYFRGRAMDPFVLAEKFFEIDEWQAHYLFASVPGAGTPKRWARAARRHLKEVAAARD